MPLSTTQKPKKIAKISSAPIFEIFEILAIFEI